MKHATAKQASRRKGKAMPVARLADIALAKTPKTKEIWIDRMDADARGQLEELREMYVSGKLDPDWSPRSLLREVIEPAGIAVCVNLATFRKWLTGRG